MLPYWTNRLQSLFSFPKPENSPAVAWARKHMKQFSLDLVPAPKSQKKNILNQRSDFLDFPSKRVLAHIENCEIRLAQC